MKGIRTIRDGITFEYVPNYDRKYSALFGWVKIYHKNKVAGVRIILPCGTKIFRPNSWYSDEDIQNL